MKKNGLVLAGGGAKGAYHLGCLQAFREFNIPIHAVSGASIGALNASIIASSNGCLDTSIEKLSNVWNSLKDSTPFKFNEQIKNLITSGLTSFKDIHSLCDTSFIESLFDKYVDLQGVKSGIPLYVSVFESHNIGVDILALKNLFLSGKNKSSNYIYINQLSLNYIREYILGSASIPLILGAREIENRRIIDGAFGDIERDMGNVPVPPLVDAGCNTIFVIHLDNNSRFVSSDYRQSNIIEIRPQVSLGNLLAIKDFSGTSIEKRIAQGFDDAYAILKGYKNLTTHLNTYSDAKGRVEKFLNNDNDNDNDNDDSEYKKLMETIKNINHSNRN